VGKLAPPAEPALPALLAACDAVASGAENAQVRVVRAPGEMLDLCRHHFAEYEWVLAVAGWRVTCDNRPPADTRYA
jgi:hypothetical protein